MRIAILFIFCLLSLSAFADNMDKKRRGKLLSLFNILSFKNEACTLASDTTMRGTCYTNQECTDRSGSVDGSCAAGFGVCCSFIVSTCGGTISQNCTYIQNAGFPSGSSTLQSCTFTFNRICPDLCNIRLDFDNFVLAQPSTLVGSCSSDTAVATSPTGASPPSNVCGTLTGQHMYLDTGTSGTAGTFAITTSTATNARTYKVKVSYIECSNLRAAPQGCVQYFTGTSNSFQSYNFQGGQQLDDQNHSICFRQEQGFCSFTLQESSTTSPDPFLLRDANNAIAFQAPTAVEVTCPVNYIQFPIASPANGNMRCGEIFGEIDGNTTPAVVPSTMTTPFVVNYLSELSTIAVTAGVTTGFNLEYNQVPC